MFKMSYENIMKGIQGRSVHLVKDRVTKKKFKNMIS